MKAGIPTTFMFLRFSNPDIAEMMALTGVDYLVIDNEHFPFNQEQMINCIRAAEIHGVPCIVRVPDANPGNIARILDMGAVGILLAHTDSYETAMAAVNAVKFTPLGHRGYGNVTRGAEYTHWTDPINFSKKWNETSMIFCMIEDRGGYEHLDEILSIPEIDGIHLGAADLSCSYGMPGDFNNPELVKKHLEIKEKTIKAGKIFCDKGYTPEAAKKQLESGTLSINTGADTVFLDDSMSRIMKPLLDEIIPSFSRK